MPVSDEDLPPPRIDLTPEQKEELHRRFEHVQAELPKADAPQETALDFAKWLLSQLPEDELDRMERQMEAKGAVQRIAAHDELLAELMRTTPRLLGGETEEEIWRQHLKVVEHAVALWEDAERLFEADRYATATFLAIACIEEVGKGGVGIWQAMAWHGSGYRGEEIPEKQRKTALQSHPKKHLLAAGAGALINARLDRLSASTGSSSSSTTSKERGSSGFDRPRSTPLGAKAAWSFLAT